MLSTLECAITSCLDVIFFARGDYQIRKLANPDALLHMTFDELPYKGLNSLEEVAQNFSSAHRFYGILFSETRCIPPIRHLDILQKHGSGVYSGTTTLTTELQRQLGGITAIITTRRANYGKFKNGTKMIEFSCKKLYGKDSHGKRSVLRRGQRVGIAMAKDKYRCISVVGVFAEFLGPFTISKPKKVRCSIDFNMVSRSPIAEYPLDT